LCLTLLVVLHVGAWDVFLRLRTCRMGPRCALGRCATTRAESGSLQLQATQCGPAGRSSPRRPTFSTHDPLLRSGRLQASLVFYWLQWPSIKHCRGHGWAVEAWAAMGQVFNVRRWFKLARGTHINAQLVPTLPSAHAKDSHLCNDPCFCVRIQHAHVVQGKWGLVALRTAQAAVRCQRAAGCRRLAPARAAPGNGWHCPARQAHSRHPESPP